MHHPNRMGEPTVGRSRKGILREPQLPNSSQSLNKWVIQHLSLTNIKRDGSVYWISNLKNIIVRGLHKTCVIWTKYNKTDVYFPRWHEDVENLVTSKNCMRTEM